MHPIGRGPEEFDTWCDLLHVFRLAVLIILELITTAKFRQGDDYMNKLIALAAIAFVLSAGAVITIMINAQPAMAGFCDNPTANC
jgi:hypothetical protein